MKVNSIRRAPQEFYKGASPKKRGSNFWQKYTRAWADTTWQLGLWSAKLAEQVFSGLPPVKMPGH
jgi:hypothetical protein